MKRNDTMYAIAEQNENLQFQIESRLIEAEQNVTEIKRESYHKKVKVWPLLTMKTMIETLVNGKHSPNCVSQCKHHLTTKQRLHTEDERRN